jgi:hypothetical protein
MQIHGIRNAHINGRPSSAGDEERALQLRALFALFS